MANLLAASPGCQVLELVNPAYAPPYLATTLASVGASLGRWGAEETPPPLADLLYAGPLEWPIHAGPAERAISSLLECLDP
jgi:hypothetical protein